MSNSIVSSIRRVLPGAWLVLVCLLTLELAARIDDRLSYGAPLFGAYDLEDLFQPTAHGWRGVPNASFVKWALNSAGLRGPEIRPDNGQTRVLTYGASETFGIYEDSGLEYPRALERDLNAQAGAGSYEVINGGIPGMRVGSGIAFLHDIGSTLHPKVVVIYPTPTHYVGVTQPYCGRPVNSSPHSVALPSLRMVERLKDRLKGALPPGALTAMRKVGIALSTWDERVFNQASPEALAAFEVDLRCAVKAARDVGAVPILVTHANRFGPVARADDDYWLTGWRLQYPAMRQTGLLDLERRANERIVAVGRQEDVRVVDAAAALSGEPANFADHVHFTTSGAAKMGALLATAVRAALVRDRI